jgi:hypothetical protein
VPVDIQSFMATMNQLEGPARPSMFAVEFTLPSSVGTWGSSSRQLSFLCDSAALPGLTVAVNDHYAPQGFGMIEKMPWNVLFTDVQLSFIGDNQGLVHSILTQWVNSIVLYNASSGVVQASGGQPFFVNYRSNYAVNMVIRLYDPTINSIIEYTLYDAFPTSLYDAPLNWGDGGMMRINARISYTRWTVDYEKLDVQAQTAVDGVMSQINDFMSGSTNSFSALNTNAPSLSYTPPSIQNNLNNVTTDLGPTTSQLVPSTIDSYSSAINLLGGVGDFSAT